MIISNKNHPINAVFERIETRCPFRPLDVFEPFGGDGTTQVIHYAPRARVNSLTAWDIADNRAARLKSVFPETDIKVCDAFEEVARLKPHFDVIIIDNNLLQAPHFEHFDLFPAIFNGLKDSAFIVISVCDDPGGYYVQREHLIRAAFGLRTESFVKDWDAARVKFYNMVDTGDFFYADQIGRIKPASVMSANDMVPVYMELALRVGFFTKYQTVVGRSRAMKYILLELKRGLPKSEREANYKDKLERKNAAESNQPKK